MTFASAEAISTWRAIPAGLIATVNVSGTSSYGDRLVALRPGTAAWGTFCKRHPATHTMRSALWITGDV